MARERSAPWVGLVLTAAVLGWRAIGTGGLFFGPGERGAAEIANDLVDALVGAVFLAGAIFAWLKTRRRAAAVFWLIGGCITVFTGRSPDFPAGHARTVDGMIRIAATLVGTSALLDLVWSLVRRGGSLGRRALAAVYSPALIGLLGVLPALFASPAEHAWVKASLLPVVALLYTQGPIYQILALVLLGRGRRHRPELTALFWMTLATVVGILAITTVEALAPSFAFPPGLGTHPYAWLQVALAIVMTRTLAQRPGAAAS